jgi:tetratricopeptide (TPR) repeat protein
MAIRLNHTLTTKAMLACFVGTPVLAFGAVHPPVLSAYISFAALPFVFLLVSPSYRPPRLDILGVMFIVLILFTLLQIVPLPAGLVKWLAPAVFHVRSRAFVPMDLPPPPLMPLTLDVTLTAMELGKLLCYAAIYWLTLSYTRRNGPSFVLNLVIVTGIIAAGIFLAHKILMLDKLYGFYTPRRAVGTGGVVNAPLINANHMAGVLGLTTAVAIGRALVITAKSRRLLSIGIAGLLGGTLIVTLSRGGIAAFLAGQCLFVLVVLVGRLDRKETRRPLHVPVAWLPVGAVLALGIGLFAAQDAVIGEFINGDIKKLDLALDGIPLVGKFWTTGVGRGAFWVGFPLVSSLSTTITFSHAENIVIQLLSDWGVLVGGFALLVSIYAVGRCLRDIPTRVDIVGVLAALVTFGIHNLVDFNSEVFGVGVIATALVGVIIGSYPSRRRWSAGRVRKPVLWVGAIGSILVGPGVALYYGPLSVDAEEQALYRAWRSKDEKPFENENLRASLQRHPASAYLPFIVGVRHYYNQSGNPLPWLARAVELNGASSAAHFYIGRILLKHGYTDQGMVELRLAARLNHRLIPRVAHLLAVRIPSFEKLSKIAVSHDDKVLLWTALGRAFAVNGYPDESEAADLAVLKIDPKNPAPLARHARRLADRGEIAQSLKLAKMLAEVPDYGPAGIELVAGLYRRMNEHEKSIQTLERGLMKFERHPGLLRALAWSRQRAGQHRGAMEAAGILKSLATNLQSRSSVAILEAQLSVAEGRIQEALARYREAHLLDQGNTALLEDIANLAERYGYQKRAVDAVRDLMRLRPNDTALKRRYERLRNLGDARKLETPGVMDDNR